VARRESVLQAGNAWYSGAYLLETLPTVLFILARHGDDPEEAIVRAVNDSKDNDTVAAIVGAAVGALHGEDALPRRWRDGLLGRTAADDDGRIFELLDRAETQFSYQDSGLDASDDVVRPRAGAPVAESDLAGVLQRAQGCLLGQLAGDALGSLVEFETPDAIRSKYPAGPSELADGGTWNTLAGQPTDDSELALTLARTLVEHGRYDREAVRRAYVSWLESDPFDCGATIAAGLTGRSNPESQANGALMRISPLGIFGTYQEPSAVIEWAREDAAITHPHEVCGQANALFAAAVSFAIRSGGGPDDVYRHVRTLVDEMAAVPALHDAVTAAAHSPPADYVRQQGWVLIAFRNALWQLLHAPSMAAGVMDTVMRGGDTDTNGAICGALLGAVHGRDAIPAQWVEKLLNCRPEVGRPGVRRPRPEVYWPVDALELAERLVNPYGG
jgi:ADP-ribosylglycohydrolase